MQQILLEYRPKLFSPSRSGPYIIGDLTIVPGVKNYDLQKWEALQGQPHLWTAIQSCLDNGILRIISQSTNEKTETPTLPKNQTEAVALVKRTFAVSLLKSWLESENRPTVKNAIHSQLKLAEEDKDKKTPTTETKDEEE
ncbi:hypothetical protein WA1_18895 [Scytonema hofmannii PCC 7110]|uniref:Uncharacterized protein n=1 Tax=Scytonema hofmannii PCC 7110 TaxID=128403 RepID=A0A139XBK5_9CYAN|nr:hypothetical protein [Scytonema hofmannii]KYC42071.1 hypothetical protein WA1_18895 [Scytonema hofmannii PCC 7110]